jgi:hypothetical protein
VRVSPEGFYLLPSCDADLTISFGTTDPADFRGKLAVDVTGRGTTGELLFRATARLDVVPAAEDVRGAALR